MYFSRDADVKYADTFSVKLFIGGDISVVKQTCREFCMEKGLCVTVDPTTFIYTGGEEQGAVIGFINYPRFPAEASHLQSLAEELGHMLMNRCFQKSFTVQGPYTTSYHSRITE
ncbi:hypothetical protein PAK_P100160c [Pseudomonas phage PAK_P1]|uniref:Uncharacterized protein n=2 Tax=Pakpunavirus TaxID=1921407 RepID=D4N417_9CAUD|nr:hypothetical protein PAK_P100160c [Pseudomonas phage PAK_P1]ADD64987.1 hypothetical protein PAK_P100160c [Pseudomonas phage PAK_P1]